MSSAVLQPEQTPIVACTICRDVQNFDLLIEDMETALGESWGDLGFSEALSFFDQTEAEPLEFVAIALDEDDADSIPLVQDIIISAKEKGIKTIIVAEDLSTAVLHQLLRQGANEFIPYPLPENELAQAIERMKRPAPEEPAPAHMRTQIQATGDREGVVLPVHGLSGGSGATTLAVNLAWELATIEKNDGPRVCLIDLDLQFGSIATYLDLPRRDAVYELLSDTESMDDDAFMQALLTYNGRLQVLTAPSDMLPLDLLSGEDVERIINVAAANFDYVVVDMPSTLVSWTEVVLQRSDVYFGLIELDMRSAQNVVRLKKALQAEELPFEKMRIAINRGPKFTDMNGKARVKRLAESLNVPIELQLPDGGKPVREGSDHGLTLGDCAPKNPLRKEIAKLAASLHEINVSAQAA